LEVELVGWMSGGLVCFSIQLIQLFVTEQVYITEHL